MKEQWESLTSTTSNTVSLDQQDGLEAAGACLCIVRKCAGTQGSLS